MKPSSKSESLKVRKAGLPPLIGVRRRLDHEGHQHFLSRLIISSGFLCATFVFSVPRWWTLIYEGLTTETQRSQSHTETLKPENCRGG